MDFRKIDVRKAFGMSVRIRRNQLGISQEDLAELADLHRTYISDIERGTRNVSLDNIERLALGLKISLPDLFQNRGSSAVKANGHSQTLVDVLLVEDNPDDVDLTLRALKKFRFTNYIHVVNDGEAALAYLFRNGEFAGRPVSQRPEIVLLDLNLPKLDGIEVLRCIKADKKTNHIPVVVLTVSEDEYNVTQCRQLGADGYIIKPIEMMRLIQATPRLNLNWGLLKPTK